MAHKSPRYCLYREFVDSYMKGHPDMTRCTSHHSAQTEWNQIKKNEELVRKKITEYLDIWNKAGAQPVEQKKTVATNGKKVPTKRSTRKRALSSEDDDPNYDPNVVESVEPTFSKRKNTQVPEEMDEETIAKEKPWIARSNAKAAKKKAQAQAKAVQIDNEKIKTPAQESVLKDLKEISERIANLIQVKSMGLLTPENQKTLKKLIEQKKQRTTDLKRLQSKQRASTRYRERKKRRVEQLCAQNPEVAAELSKIFRPSSMRMQIEEDCPDLLQIIAEIARVGGATDNKGKACASLDDLKDKIKERGYEIRKSSLYYRLMPNRALSHDGKKHVITVPVRLRKLQTLQEIPKHEDSHFTGASLRHVKDLAGIFGQDCVFYLTQDTKAKISIGRPSAKVLAPLIMHLDYQQSSTEPQTAVPTKKHQYAPCVYAASIIDDTGLIGYAGPTYISIRSAKHDRLTHETHSIDFDRLVQLKEFEKFARDHLGRVKPIVVIGIDSSGAENNTRYPKTLAAAIDKFKKYNLDALFIVSQAPGQALFNVVERRLAPLSHDLAGLILPHDHFATHLNDAGSTEHAELEKQNFKATGEVLAEVWSINVIDEHPVVAEYINPPPMIDEQLKMVDTTLALDSVIDRICSEEQEEAPLEQRINQSQPGTTVPMTEIKTECDIDEYWCATHVLQTQYTIQIIRCNNPTCCTPWRSNYIQVFPHRFNPPPVPFNRSSRGVKMAEIESSSAAVDPVSPFYGNLFQRIQFHGIVINRTHNDLLPFDACCPSLQTKLPSRVCSICKQYIPSAIRLRNHYKIHEQQYASNFLDYNNNKEEEFTADNDLHDPYEMSMLQMKPTQKGVCMFTDMIEWLKSDFEDDPVVDTKAKSTAATASAMIRKDKQMAASQATATTTTIEQEKTTSIATNNRHQTIINKSFRKEQVTTITDDTQSTTTESQCIVDVQTENGSVLDAMEKLAVLDDGVSSIGNGQSQQSWDDLDDLIEKI
ncbi:unnamed protein product [Rotaria socialis]|uniref:C2H2-type domain-containing protein n=1 Tax=Rotaria socialis TaxID=392032 RepID=A0A820KC47_9BILA|nr:unnamed protein product [Rotaria socialis]CAF3288644.1 unnamed protein product [Rotaria socialis]CAF3389872.1 unnamed protein product [Rotaria socialis]CAF4279338.1 unnamed protein product [Rotaria socialis]CAF4334868.1 unnamed protein product [Rotaria socialis]